MAGGKGVNVARALKALGQPVIATGVAGGPTGTRIIEQLTEEAILSDFVRIREESRTSTAVVDPTTGVQTEINERGPEVSAAELELFKDKLLYLAQGAEFCVFSGSLPRGVPSDLYAQLIHELQRLDVTTVLDAEGEALRLATRAEPSVVSPNELEAEELVGHEFGDEEDRPGAVREMVELGAREAILTLPTGCIGLVGTDGDRRLYRVTIDPGLVDARSGVGSGDAFLAGYMASRYRGRSAEDCLRFAVACVYWIETQIAGLWRRRRARLRGCGPAASTGGDRGAPGSGREGRPLRPFRRGRLLPETAGSGAGGGREGRC